jgi:hypothetical protein
MPPPKPPLPAAISNTAPIGSEVIGDPTKLASVSKDETEKRKPDWLEELSRKQAHRKSGLVSEML